MRKYLQTIFVMLCPYVVVVLILSILLDCVVIEKLIEMVPGGIWEIIAGFYFIALLSAIVTFVLVIVKKRHSREVLLVNMIIKLFHIPAYIFIFLCGMISMLTIIGLISVFILLFIDIVTIIVSGIIGLGGVIRMRKEGMLSRGNAVILGMAQFLFCIDVIASIMLYITVKKDSDRK